MTEFNGYPAGAFSFFSGLLESEMDREWFEAHKDDYYDNIHKPSQDFILVLGNRLKEVLPEIEFDDQRSLMRIYRDIRFSKDKTPYKDYQGFTIWEGARSRPKENPGFHFGLTVDGLGLKVGAPFGFDKALLTGFRDGVVDDKKGQVLADALDGLQSDGYAIEGEKGKRVPNGYDKSHPRADLLLYRSLHVDVPRFDVKTAQSAGLVDAVIAHIQKTIPLHRWLVSVDSSTG